MLKARENFQGLNITFNTNEDCNLACTYCYEINKKKKVLKLDHAKKFIDLILDDKDPIGLTNTKDEWILKRGLILDFIGGDSLMHPDLIDEIVSYFKIQSRLKNHKWKDNWRISISTNGTLFGNPRVQELIDKYQHVMSVSVSIDGCPELHDMCRVYNDGRGSIETIREWWPWYLSKFGDNGRVTKSTLSKESIPYIYDSLVFLHEEMGITHVNQNFIFENMELEQKDIDLLNEQMEKSVNYLLEHRHDLYWGLLSDEEGPKSYCKNCETHPNTGWCGSGAMPALSVDGDIYPCFRFLPHTQDQDTKMQVGSVKNGFDRKQNFLKVREATREKISDQECKECPIESLCAWCVAGGYIDTKTLSRQKHICNITKVRAKWSKIYWDKYNELEKN